VRQDHDIFKAPHAIEPTFQQRKTPANYFSYPEGKGMSETLPVWLVQTVDYSAPWIDAGIVSTPYGFEDSPDCEIISGGINSKGPESIALARQANLFLWGFFAPPSQLTDEARRVFVNAVCYIDRFDGHRPLVKRKAQARDAAANYVAFAETYPEHAQRMLGMTFSSGLVANYGTDLSRYRAFLEENLEYLLGYEEAVGEGEMQFMARKVRLDEDAKALGVSNRSLELLERCIALLEKGERVELAWRVLERYTDHAFQTPQQWSDWLSEHRDRLFFTDVGGYKWMVNPHR
jgi:hypothetical protein